MGAKQKEHLKHLEQKEGEKNDLKYANITCETNEENHNTKEDKAINAHISMSLSEGIGEVSCSHCQDVERMGFIWEENSQKSGTDTDNKAVNKDQIHEKKNWGLKGTKSLKKKKPPDSDQTGQRKKSYTYDEKVQKLNQENLEKATVILVNSSPPESCPEEESCISIAIQSRIPTPQRTPIIISEEKEHISASPDEYSNSELQAKDLCNRCVECTGHYSPGAQDLEGKTKPVALFDETEKSIDGKNEYEDAEYDEEIEDEIVEKEDKSALDAEEETKSLKGYGKTTYNTDAIHDISQYPRAQEVERAESVSSESSSTNDTLALPEVDLSETEPSSNSESQVTDETVLKDDTKKSWVDTEGTELKTDKTEDVEEITINLIIPDKEPEADCEINDKKDQSVEEEDAEFSFDVSPPPPAPFTHRIVSAKHAQINSFYTVETSEMLGGGRFGQVHRCAEKSSGLSLAAKIIKVKSHKEKEEVKNEIQVMNQLNHVNLIQLYDAFESRNDIVLIMEYVEGGELFDRIIDENYNLSEADTIQFIKQIIEGIQYMHQMYIVHLDLKPENIMCVSRTAYQVKIIDFGLARRYKPREKLKVHFGTPEFLAPEVVNYDYVSFPTDMWSVGVIAYMLLSGLSPFLGEDYNETLNNILACQYDFEGEEFENISEPAKDFITKLLIKEKCWRMSATEALKHLWLSDSKLHYRISQQCLENICPVSDASGNK
ncbi:myosin light chain kinase 3 isoform X1 [Xenopus laevis]|uniref:Myosin light chain kinase 3 isoform X1 n=1 Tax=Xenopus laevis TaxID=8355 RepID=A0A8J0VMH1_XENLA|nr:myosin light chain kinase 3 isoform X1 [Xenopus laevis]